MEESRTTETTTEVIEGTQFECGFVSPYFVTDSDRGMVALTNAQILILNDKLSKFYAVMPIMESCINNGDQYLIIVNDVDTDVLNTLVANRVNTSAKFCVVKAPYFGERRKAFLQDLAITTGGLVVNSENDLNPNSITKVLGQAQKINITKTNTTIINGDGTEETKQIYLRELNRTLSVLTSEQEKQDLQERIDNLRGGVAVIYVGANSAVELLEKKDRIDDALCATRAAIAEGIVPGGGLTYIRALESLKDLESDNDDEQTGINIIKKAIIQPFKQICENAGVSGNVVLYHIETSEPEIGYNAKTGKLENLLVAGVIDPAKVARVALENAASVASTFLTTECAITHLND